MPRNVRHLLPLTPLSFHILLALAQGQRHGYAIMKAVEANWGDLPVPGSGTFYSAIRRMTAEGLIEETAVPADPDSHDSRRRYYVITPLGRDALRAESQRLESLVTAVRATIDTGPTG